MNANIGLIYYGPKWSWAEMVLGRNGHGPKWLWAEMTRNLIYGKIIFTTISGISGTNTTELGMQHRGLGPMIV